jgi:hypothetical protein
MEQIHDFDFSKDLVLGFLQFAEPSVLRQLTRGFASKQVPSRVNISGMTTYRDYVRYCQTFGVDTIQEVRQTFWRRSHFVPEVIDNAPIGWTPASAKKLTIYSDYDNEIVVGQNIEILSIEASQNKTIVIPNNVREIYLGKNFQGVIIRWPETEYTLFVDEDDEEVSLDEEDYGYEFDFDDIWA